MNITNGYKIEKVSVSSLFRGFEKIYKTVRDTVDKNILWIYVSKTSNNIKANAILKYNTTTKSVERILDFGTNDIYSIHVSESYIAFLSSPPTAANKRYFSFLNRADGNTGALKSLYYASDVIAGAEFKSIYQDNQMYFDGRYYWTFPQGPASPIKKIDTIDFGATLGLEGLNAPGGSCLNAVTLDITNWCPTPEDSLLTGKAYPFKGDLYFFPNGGGIFKVNITTGLSTAIVNNDYLAISERMACGLQQLQEEDEFSTSGETILFSIYRDTNIFSPIDTMGVMNLSSMEFTTFPMPRSGGRDSLTKVVAFEDNKIFYAIESGDTIGLYFDCVEGDFREYHILTNDSLVLKAQKSPSAALDSETMLFFDTGAYAYKLIKTTPCRVVVHHILEDNSVYGAEEIFYGAEGSTYEILAKAIENKEVSSIIGQKTGIYTKADIVVEFHYSPVKTQTFLKVVAKDTSDATIQEITLNGLAGDTYSTNGIEIAGYVLQNTPINASGTLVLENPPVIYVYRKLTSDELYSGSSYLSIVYEDETGAKILPSLYAVFPLGSSYNIPAETIPGYTLTSPALVSGTCYDNTQYIVFRYEKKPNVGLVRINYMTGTTIMKTSYLEGTINVSGSFTPEAIAGFNIDLTPIAVTLKAVPDIVSIVCTPIVGLLLVSHRDVYDDEDVFPKEYTFASSVQETSIEVREKIITNYKAIEQSIDKAVYNPINDGWSLYKDETLYSFSAGKLIEIEIVYDTVNSSVKVFYKKGETVLLEDILYGLNGETYTTAAEDYEQYQIDTIEGDVSGTFGSREQTVTYFYKDRECEAYVEHVDKATGALISRTDYVRVYGTELDIPFETFAGYTYVDNSLDVEPDEGVITFVRNATSVRFYYTKIDPTTMLKPSLVINRDTVGVQVNCGGIDKIIEGLRYKVEKRMNTGAWEITFPKEVESADFKTLNRVLNLIEDDGTTMTYTPYLGTLQTIPSKAILKSWLETDNNGIQVDYIDIREFEQSPELYLRDASGNIKYNTIVNGTYSTQEACTLSGNGMGAVYNWINLGLGYVDCSRRYRISGRTPEITTQKALMLKIIQDMKQTTGLNSFTNDVFESPATNYSMKIDEVRYDKISNRIIVKASSYDNGNANAHAVYEYRVTVLNCNDGTTYTTSIVNPTTSIDTTLPIEKYLFAVDDNASTIPPIESRTASSTFYYRRQETIKFIDKYIHIIGEDLFGRQTALLNHRYYKEITIEDLNSINSVIHYSPKIIKENHRHRGPIESHKLNNFNTEVWATLNEIQSIFDGQETKLQGLKDHSNTGIYELYIDMKDRSGL